MRQSQSGIEVIGLPVGNFVRAVRMVCEEKGLDHDLTPVPPHSPELKAAHPLGKMPALRHGDVTVAESWAITRYLDAVFPDVVMIPSGPAALAAEVEQWISIVMTGVDPVMIREYAFAYIFPRTPDKSPDRAAIDAALPKMETLVALLDERLRGRDYLAGDRFTFADALLLATLVAPRRYPEGARIIEAAPNLTRYLDLHAGRPSFVATQVVD